MTMSFVRAALTLGCCSASSPYVLDDGPGLGLRWEGVGAISGGGATTKLLMDYPPSVAADILDYLFKPGFGLSLQMLKVEIGGDTDSTEGAEPSHMHFAGDADYNRGYEWWLMKEAKRRNPEIKLYGLAWGWPGWLDPNATADQPAKKPFADAATTANYTLAWLLGARREHNLTIDYVGQWNERAAPKAYAEALRAAVNASELAGKTTVLNRLAHYPGALNEPDAQGCKQYEWNTTDGSRWADEEGSINDGRSARCLARVVNRNYISLCHTATFQWHLISSFYDYLPWDRCGVAVANQPWSGAYEITSPTWALAHTSQFAPVGWRYAAHDAGVHMLQAGGSLVTRVSEDLADFSVVIEKMGSAESRCARGKNPDSNATTEEVVLQLKGAFLAAAQRAGGLQVWRSNLTSGNGRAENPPSEQLMQRGLAMKVSTDGKVSLTVHEGELYTLTTLNVGGKAAASSPPATPFPIPYKQTFDDESASAPPRIWYDQMGAWEVQPTPYGDGRGNVMRQVVPIWPICWGYSCAGPTTYFGPNAFSAPLTVSMDVRLEDHAVFAVIPDGHGSHLQNISLDSAGTWAMGELSGSAAFSVDTWHRVALHVDHGWQAAYLDGVLLGNLSQAAPSALTAQATCEDSGFPRSNVPFPHNLTGKQALGLSPGPASATSEELCMQACCDSGYDCLIYQFAEHPTKGPQCLMGQSDSFRDDPTLVYRGGARDPHNGWRLKVTLSRYIFASIDNFQLTRGPEAIAIV